MSWEDRALSSKYLADQGLVKCHVQQDPEFQLDGRWGVALFTAGHRTRLFVESLFK